MENLINSIYDTIKDYRADEENTLVHQSPQRIFKWILQFDEVDRIPILTEINNLFEKRYLPKQGVCLFLKAVVEKLTQDLKFPSPSEFLRNADILNLQAPAKSQSIMRRLFDGVIQTNFGIQLSDCGTLSKKYSIYLDDVLCTGLRFYTDLNNWSEMEFGSGKTNLEAVTDGSTLLIGAYVFIHKKNYDKKKAQMGMELGDRIKNNHKMYGTMWIDNYMNPTSSCEVSIPIDHGNSHVIQNCQENINSIVDEYVAKRYTVPEEFYRPASVPSTEKLFTSEQNRIVVEHAFLKKGIEILSSVKSVKANVRPLGFNLPSTKNFGFGALCFTWRSVPNNAPLVFWYEAPGFTPLFKVDRG